MKLLSNDIVIRLSYFIIQLLFISGFAFSQTKIKELDSLKNILTDVYNSDQKDRFKIIEIQKKGNVKTEEYKNFISKMRKTDSLNLLIVSNILDKYGYLGQDEVGIYGSQALFLVIQHADLPAQEKYLPVIRKAVMDKKTYPSNLALLEDRVALRQGKEQIYGSQIWIDKASGKKYVQPMIEPDSVNKRRESVGLNPIEEYLKQSFQIEWNLQEYYNSLPELKNLLGKRKQ